MRRLIAPLAAVAVAFSTLAPLVPADAAPRQPLTKTQCQRLYRVQPWVPGYLNMKHCSGLFGQVQCMIFGKPYCE